MASTTKKSNDPLKLLHHKFADLPNPTAESNLTMAVADLIHSLGLPFSRSSDPKFRLLLKIAKAVPSTYTPPSRNQVLAGKLLELNYDQKSILKRTD